ncbi:MAG: hypothetical protein GF308_15480, partial [Candidatus Heimdallarchaeota archaeon]|nr:hypothetical protein [Candidatus Heimdallarchaeota archaeon]
MVLEQGLYIGWFGHDSIKKRGIEKVIAMVKSKENSLNSLFNTDGSSESASGGLQEFGEGGNPPLAEGAAVVELVALAGN